MALALGTLTAFAGPAAAATYSLTEGYRNNLTVSEVGGGTVTWEDAGANGVVTLATPDGNGQAVVNLPVAPLGLTYGSIADISSLTYTVPATVNQTAALNVEVARTIAGPYRTLNFAPAAGTTGLIDAGAGLWIDRSTGEEGLTWAELQAKYGASWSVNKIWVSLGTGQGTSSSQIDQVTVNDNVYDFVYTGQALLTDLTPDYENPLTVQEVGAGTATWESTMCTNGAVTLTTTADEDQAVVNLPVLPLGVAFGALSDVTSVAVAVAANTGGNASINIQVYDDLINGPYRTVQHVIQPGFTGVVEATAQQWTDRSDSGPLVSWSEILTRYGDLPVNRVWLSLGTFQGAATSSIDYVMLNAAIYDFVVENPAAVPAPALPASVPGTVDGSLVLDPATVLQGGTVAVMGEEFEPTSPVNLGLYSPVADLGSSTTEVDGVLDTDVTIPANAPVGEHTVLAIGGACQEDYTVGERVLTAAVSVEEGTPPPVVPCEGGNCYYLKDDLESGDADYVFAYGKPTDKTSTGDWNGDGSDTLTLRRSNQFFEKNSLGGGDADRVYSFGNAGDVILSGDWNGNGTDTLAVRRGKQYFFDLDGNGGVADVVLAYGLADDVVQVGDWNGDGTDTLTLRRGKQFFEKDSLEGGEADRVYSYGTPDDDVISGDWNGNGTDTLAVRRANQYYFDFDGNGGEADAVIGYGRGADVVLVGDWNGDGTDTLGVRR